MTRGLYCSLLATKIGEFTLPDVASNILGDPSKEMALVNYVSANGFTSISFYDLSSIFPNKVLSARLASLITSLRNVGVTEVNSIVANTSLVTQTTQFNGLFHRSFNGIVTEIEFWAPNQNANVAPFYSLMSVLRAIAKSRLKSICYIGWLSSVPGTTQIIIGGILSQLCDRVLLHAYVKNPAQAAGYIATRVPLLTCEVWPIFSIEGTGFSAGSELFMGDWMKAGGTFNQAEAAVPGYTGYQWYEYGFLRAIK